MVMTPTSWENYLGMRADERVASYPIANNSHQIFYLSLTYLLAVYVVVPIYMRNRKPFDLKTIIYWYNIFQIVSNSWIIFEFVRSGWKPNFYYTCTNYQKFDTDQITRLLRTYFILICLKCIDYLETIFFVLRKKNNQVSFLHVVHHLFTPMVAWLGIRYAKEYMFQVLCPIVINCFIHVLMYTYYLLASMGHKDIGWYKQFLTTLQLVQFVINFWTSFFVARNCGLPHHMRVLLLYYAVPFNLLLTVLFSHFYVKTYFRKKKTN